MKTIKVERWNDVAGEYQEDDVPVRSLGNYGEFFVHRDYQPWRDEKSCPFVVSHRSGHAASFDLPKVKMARQWAKILAEAPPAPGSPGDKVFTDWIDNHIKPLFARAEEEVL